MPAGKNYRRESELRRVLTAEMSPCRSGPGSVNGFGGGVCFVIFGAARPETSAASEEDYRVLGDGSGTFELTLQD